MDTQEYRCASPSEWFVCPKPNPRATLRLFCFPYAGAGAGIYRSWQGKLPVSAEVVAIQLPGRGSRLNERPLTRIAPMVEAIYRDIHPYLELPCAFFGHSMGALIGFELVRTMARGGDRLPLCLFVSGRQAPHLPVRTAPTFDRPSAEFIQELQRINGTPREILSSPELMELLLPAIRADFEAVETYEYVPGGRIGIPIVACSGIQDSEVPAEEIGQWNLHAGSSFKFHSLPGDHFFVHSSETDLLAVISKELQKLLGRPRTF